MKELVQPRASSVMKLIAAWAGLQVETQIAILMYLNSLSPAQFPQYLRRKIDRKAYESSTPYIRHLATRNYKPYFGDKLEEEWQSKIVNDSDQIVRFGMAYCFDDPKAFWASPHEARLMQIAPLNFLGIGKALANVISYAIENELYPSQISELEMYEVLAECLMNDDVIEHIRISSDFWDGGVATTALADLQALRDLLPRVPPEAARLVSSALARIAEIHLALPTNDPRASEEEFTTTKDTKKGTKKFQ